MHEFWCNSFFVIVGTLKKCKAKVTAEFKLHMLNRGAKSPPCMANGESEKESVYNPDSRLRFS